MGRTLLAAMAMILAGCAATVPPSTPIGQADGLTRAALGQTIGVGGPKVTPLEVLEDSRCPMNARCVWAGRVKLCVRIGLGRGDEVRDLVPGEPVPVADGTLELVAVPPDKAVGEGKSAIAPADYRFAFHFMGGL